MVTLGTERHRPIAEGADNLNVIGCFALTELGYIYKPNIQSKNNLNIIYFILGFGNNAVEMETTAIYD